MGGASGRADDRLRDGPKRPALAGANGSSQGIHTHSVGRGGPQIQISIP
jgi:hypothetical protein